MSLYCHSVKIKRTSKNPITDLIERGMSLAEIAVAWQYKSDAVIRLLRNFDYVPPHDKAALMARTFGWRSAGQVIDFWAAKMDARNRKARKARESERKGAS